MASLRIMMTLSLTFLLTHPTFSQPSCKSKTFPNKKTFDNCNDLPTLDAVLHWTYDPSKSTLSMAFTAPPPTPDGWVSWALNPEASGMMGAQALMAFKPSSGGPITVDTLDIMSYHAINKGPISYNVSDLSAEASSDGKITIFGTWVIPNGQSIVNQVWQVGPVEDGKPGKHASEDANMRSKMKLDLANGPNTGSSGAPTEPPTPVAGGDGETVEASRSDEFVNNGAGGAALSLNNLRVSMSLGLGAIVLALF